MGVYNTFSNIIQSYKHSDKPPYHDFRNPDNAKLEEVACVDGVWLATTKKVTDTIKFDEQTFTGFHAYDIDYSIAVGQQYKVCVTYEVLMNHLSEGSYSREWLEDTLKLHKKWAAHLPINTKNFTPKECAHMEKVTFKDFVKKLIAFKFPAVVAYEILKAKIYWDFGIYWKLRFFVMKAYLIGK